MAGAPLVGRPSPSATLADDDVESCLCLVVGYAKKDGLIARVTAEAERRVRLSPALDDVLRLRSVDLGPQPGPAGDRSRPVRRIVTDLMMMQETSGRSHFALIVIAKSATTIEELASRCAAEPFLARLRMRFVGIASSDDREPENRSVEIASSPEGSWRSERDLVDALRQRCAELPRYFAARGQFGLTRAEIDALRHDRVQSAADRDGSVGAADGAADEVSVPDILDDTTEVTAPASDQDADRASAVGGAAVEAAAGRLSAIGALRRRPGIPRRRGKQETATTSDPARTAMGLVYLSMIADQDIAADPTLDRLRAALLAMDRRLAAEPHCGYQVRVIHGRDGDLRGDLNDAGRVGRRAAKRLVKTGDFTTVLKVIRSSLRRDRELVQTIATAAGLAVVPPTVIIFSVDPPMADRAAAAVFADLIVQATVAWVVPGRLEGLVSPAFGTASGALVLGEHQGVVNDILEVMRGAQGIGAHHLA